MKFFRILLKIVIPASQIRHYMCITNINQFLLFREIVTLQSEVHVLYKYTVGKIQRFLILQKALSDDSEYFRSK
jgi:hypothetical protein